MRVGLTYDLRDDYLAQGFTPEETAEFDSIVTVNAIEAALIGLGFQTERVGNIKQLVRCLAEGKRWDFVFNFAEGLYGLSREAQIPALLEAYQIPFTFSDSAVLTLTLDKSVTKSILQKEGIPTAPFQVITSLEQLKHFQLKFPVFAKPVAEGTSKGITSASYIETKEALTKTTKHLLERYRQPVLVETYLPGREFTVGIVGQGASARVLGVLEIILRENAEKYACSYANKEQCESLVEYKLVADAEALQASEIALSAWQKLNCRDAGRVDLRSDELGRPQFLEVNPLSGLHPTHSDLPILATQLGLTYPELIKLITAETCKRINSKITSDTLIA